MQSALDYRQITDKLADSPLNPTAAEAHGILCGLICAGAPKASEVWIDELYVGEDAANLPDAEVREAMQAVASCTRDEIEGPGPGFTPLLPEDDRPLRERAVGLYDWSRGFIYGLGLAGVKQEDLSGQGREVLDDFAGITRMDLDALDEGEDNERALAELQEFIWVAAMLLYEERGRERDNRRVQG
jgi:hypothetical protein